MNKSSKITASELVLSAIFFLQQKNGVTAKDITKFICEKRGCKQSHVRSEVKKALERATENGIFSKKRGLYRIESGFGRSRISIKIKGMNKGKRMKKGKNSGGTKGVPQQDALEPPSDSVGIDPVMANPPSFPSSHGLSDPFKCFQMAALSEAPIRTNSSVSRLSMERLRKHSNRNDDEEEDDDEDFFEEDEDDDDDIDYFEDDQFPNNEESFKDYHEPPKKKLPVKRKATSRSKSRNKSKVKKRKLSKPRKKTAKTRKRQTRRSTRKPERYVVSAESTQKIENIKSEKPEIGEDLNYGNERPDEDSNVEEQPAENECQGCSDDEDEYECGEENGEYGSDYYYEQSPDEYLSGEENQQDKDRSGEGGKGEGSDKKEEEEDSQKEKIPVALKATAKSGISSSRGDGKSSTECGKVGTAGGSRSGQSPILQQKTPLSQERRGEKKSRQNRSSSLFRTTAGRMMMKSRK